MLHQALLDLHQALGYEKQKGLCHGFSLRWLEAYLIGEGERFERRMQRILATPTEVLVQSIQQVKTKKGPLNLEENDLLELLSFFDTLELFQNPTSHPIFNETTLLTQDSIDVISKLASSQKIQDLGGLLTLNSYPYILNVNEINTYLEQLSQLFEEHTAQSTAPIGLLLGTEGHALALMYQPSQGWVFRDSNQKFLPKMSTQRIAEQIHRSMQRGINNSPFVAFNAKVILPHADSRCKLLEERLALFQTVYYPITKSIAKRQANFINLAYIAAKNGHTAVLEFLAKSNADLNQAMNNGATPALIAARNGHIAVLEFLVKSNADLNQAMNNGVTPAFIAAANGNTAVLEILAKSNVDLNQTMNNGATPAFIAAQNGHIAILEILAKNADLNSARNDGATPAFIAAQNGHTAVLEVLLKSNADLNKAMNNGATPAFVAAYKGHIAVLEFLAKNNADLNQATNDGATPACIAAQNGHTAVFEIFAKNKVDLNKAMNNGATPAYSAAKNGNTAVLEILAKSNADLNKAMNDGATPAFIAAKNGHTAVLEILAKSNADLNKAMNNGATPAFIAAPEGHLSVVNTLINLGVDLQIPFLSSKAQLIEFASTRGHEVIERMNTFLTGKTDAQLNMYPYDIAIVMGHYKIASMITDYCFRKQSGSILHNGSYAVSTNDASFFNQNTSSSSLANSFNALNYFNG